MTVLMSAIFKKKFPNFGFDVVNLIMGFDEADSYMRVRPGRHVLTCRKFSDRFSFS